MIRSCEKEDFETLYEIINDSAFAYKGFIPADVWHEPYMSREALRNEINDGVLFSGYEEDGMLTGVMGIQHVTDVSLIRHAYVRTARQSRGIGGRLLDFLKGQTTRPMLVGTWAGATWAVRFYEKHGFERVSLEEKDRLLKKYWTISPRQVEISLVLADSKWFHEVLK